MLRQYFQLKTHVAQRARGQIDKSVKWHFGFSLIISINTHEVNANPSPRGHDTNVGKQES